MVGRWIFLSGCPVFRGYVSLRQGNSKKETCTQYTCHWWNSCARYTAHPPNDFTLLQFLASSSICILQRFNCQLQVPQVPRWFRAQSLKMLFPLLPIGREANPFRCTSVGLTNLLMKSQWHCVPMLAGACVRRKGLWGLPEKSVKTLGRCDSIGQ